MSDELKELIENTAIEADDRLNKISPEGFNEMLEIYGDNNHTTYKNFSHAMSEERIDVDDFSGEVICS